MQSRRSFLHSSALSAAILPLLSSTKFAYPFSDSGQVTARSMGCVGDGHTDDARCLTTALNCGHVVDGEGLTYAVGGNLEAGSSFKGLINANLKQTLPRLMNVRTLSVSGARNFLIQDVRIDRGGDGSEVVDIKMIDKTSGLFIRDCGQFICKNVSCYGGGIGSGLIFVFCEDFHLQNPKAYDLRYNLDHHVSDDAIQGIFIGKCSRFVLQSPYCSNIGGSDGLTYNHDNNRGVATAGCRNFEIRDIRVENVGQGLDVTGGGIGNHEFKVIDGHASDCFSWGCKFANSAQSGFVKNVESIRCGIGGFVVSGPGDPALSPSRSIIFEECSAIDVLGNYAKTAASFGFGVIKAKQLTIPYPQDVVFRNCVATTSTARGRMRFGFRNDISASFTNGHPNRVIACKANGFTDAAFFGFD